MRTQNSLRNIIVGVISQFLVVVIGLVSRSVFIHVLGVEMLGVNGLLTSIISMLSLTELGIGAAIVYNLYKPLAENDREKIIALVQFYKKTYRIITAVVLMLALAVVPFLKVIVKEDISSALLSAIFFLFLADTIMSYLVAHKRSLISADQKKYIVNYLVMIGSVLISLSQITILLLTHNFILFLSVRVVIRIAENLALSKIVDKRYPYIKTKESIPLDKKTKNNIVANTKALSMHVLGRYLINGTDNIIISRFIGIIFVGLYSNYLLIINTITSFTNQFYSGVLASFGNLIAIEDSKKSLEVFKKADFLNFAIINFATVSLLCLVNPFISLWLSKDVLLSFPVVILLAVNFYIVGVSAVVRATRAGAGVFRPDRYLHLVLAALNLVVSIGLAKIIGIAGVFIGTLICILIREVAVLPHIVYKYVFKKPVREYYKTYILFFMTMLLSAAVAFALTYYLLPESGLVSFIIKCMICLVIPNAFVVLFYRKTQEFEFAWMYFKKMLSKFRRRIRNEV